MRFKKAVPTRASVQPCLPPRHPRALGSALPTPARNFAGALVRVLPPPDLAVASGRGTSSSSAHEVPLFCDQPYPAPPAGAEAHFLCLETPEMRKRVAPGGGNRDR